MAAKTPARRAGVGARRNQRTREGLTPLQQAVCTALLEGLAPGDAAKRAGASIRYVHKCMGLPAFQSALQAGQQKVADAAVCDRIDLLRAAFGIVKADIRTLFDEDGRLREPLDWPDDIALAVAGMDVKELYEGEGKAKRNVGRVVKLRLHPKVPAIDVASKLVGAYAAEKAPVGPDGKPVRPRTKVVVVPAMRTPEQMASHGDNPDNRPPPKPEEPPPQPTGKIRDKLRKLGGADVR